MINNKLNNNNNELNCIGFYQSLIYKNYYILFGECNYNSKKRVVYNNFYIFNFNTKKWYFKFLNTIGRESHIMCLYNNNIIIHGGLDKNRDSLSDTILINCNNLLNNNIIIKHKNILTNIGKLYYINAFIYNNMFIHFGGEIPDPNRFEYYSFRYILINKMDNNLIEIKNKQTCFNIKKYKGRHENGSCLLNINGNCYIFFFGGQRFGRLDDYGFINVTKLKKIKIKYVKMLFYLYFILITQMRQSLCTFSFYTLVSKMLYF